MPLSETSSLKVIGKRQDRFIKMFDNDLLTQEELEIFERYRGSTLWLDEFGIVQHSGDKLDYRPYVWMDDNDEN